MQGGEGLVGISYATSMENIHEGVRRLNDWLSIFKHHLINRPVLRILWAKKLGLVVLLGAETIHIIGSGLNSQKPANRAILDLNGLGWRLVPIHVGIQGNISNIPIRKEIDEGIIPEVVVLFLAPQRALDVVKKSIQVFWR